MACLASDLSDSVVSNSNVQPANDQNFVQQLVLQLARCEPLHSIYNTYLPKITDKDKRKCCALTVIRLLTIIPEGGSAAHGEDLIIGLPDGQRAWVVKVGDARPH